MFGGAEIPDFKTFDPHVALVLNGQHADSILKSEMSCVQDRRLAWIASKRNESIRRIAGCVDADELFVDPPRTLTVLPARAVSAAC